MNPSSTKTTVRFVERTYRYTFDAQLLCRYNDYRFTLSVYPGIYEVVVIGDSDPDITNLPPAAYIAVDRLQIP